MNMKHRRFSLDSSVSLEDGDGGNLLDQRKGSRSRPKKSGERRKSHSLEEAQLETQGLGCSLNRSNSLRSQTIEEESFHRPDGVIVTKNSFVKYNKAFHKLFEDIPAEEKLTHAFTCALQKEVLYHGKLFVSVNYVCFYSSVLLKDTKVVVHVSSIKEVKKQNSALSMLSIHTTDGDKYLLVSLRNRQVCYKILQTVCTQAQTVFTQQQGEQGENGSSSSHVSPGENGVDDVNQDIATISSHSSLEDSMEQSLPKETVYSDLPSRGRDSSTPRSSISKDQDDQFTFTEEDDSANSCFWRVTERIKSLLLIREMSNLNVLLSIYLFLVVLLLLSSGYIGLRILALEEQLSSLGALPEFSIHHREYRYKET
ncbi:GRAM domain-containing protein 2A isoform X1 [Oncorhynchus kisutch]|uniref:GRAM domain-containing protein 2A n=2 Tax=Oncorhynchus kisutch TaxID=8019 RepID=A0A8C7K232_ONCKI|nr:GRAM domain-containing protein 2A isoform X1 [Oncorhynchus kisutch]